MSGSRIKIDVAKGCGFCAGVRRAVDMAKRSANQYGLVAMLGDIVHNERVIRELENRGIQVVDSPEKVQDNPVLLRAHGTTPNLESTLREMGLTVIDATCPLVREIHKAIRILEKEGRVCIIAGDKGHDEVVGIASQVKNARIVSTPEDAHELPVMKKAGMVVQSTRTLDNLKEIVSILLPKVSDLRVINTICGPSRRNQLEAERIARENDVVIVIGSRTSANTKRLFEVVRRINKRVYLISSADELEIEWFKVVQSVGITAGASTPDDVIQEVIHKIQNL
jgi:4-hydroxy-3-methylbut-2-en-1-yl diphosphate reductase